MDTQSPAASHSPVSDPARAAPGLGDVAVLMLGRGALGGGGLAGLEAAFAREGLADRFASWVSPGPNLPVSADEIGRVLGPSLTAMAASGRADRARLAAGLAELLPGVVDRLTPDGHLPSGRLASLWALGRLLLAGRGRGAP